LSAAGLAWGIHDVVNENMASAARVHIAEHGKDPRRYALLCTGGAGPVHAYYVAKKLGLSRLIAPRGAGVASALGLLIAPARVDRVATVAREMEQVVWPDLEATFARLEADARAVLAATLPHGAAPAIARLADIRYVGQASELVVPLPAGPYTAASRGALMQAFEASYVAAFTRTPPTTQVEIINVRVSASIAIDAGALPAQAAAAAQADPIKGTRPVYFPEFREFRPTAVYDRYALLPGQAFAGPAIVEERESTLVVGPGGRFEVAASGNIIVSIG
jgi:N-methylhydantoinase A